MQVFEEHWITVDDVRLRYWQVGSSGTPVVLLHGIGCSALEWNRNLAALGEHHRVYALDLPGSGGSEIPGGGVLTPERLAGYVLGFLRESGLGPAHLAGNSLGGRVALECAIAAPDSVRSLLPVAPAGIGRETIINFRLASLRGLGELLTRPSRFGLGMLWRLACFDAAHVEPARIEAKLADARRPRAQAVFLGTLRSLLGLGGFHAERLARFTAALRHLRVPMLIVWGRQDRFLPVAHAEVLRALVPGARLEILERCGHVPQIEHAESFNRLALAFWRGVEAGQSARRTET